MNARETQPGSSLEPVGSAFHQIKDACTGWRFAERRYAHAVLTAEHPERISALADEEARALGRLRVIIDSEPWAAIATEYLPNDKVTSGE